MENDPKTHHSTFFNSDIKLLHLWWPIFHTDLFNSVVTIFSAYILQVLSTILSQNAVWGFFALLSDKHLSIKR